MKTKFVKLRENTHQQVKILAAQTGRRINGDLLDDLVLFGIEEMQKIFASGVTSKGYKGTSRKNTDAAQ